MKISFIIIIALLVSFAVSDIYLQGCGLKGSNNRVSASNNQNNRLFDSQNNNAGGYGIHPKQHFYVGSEMQIQWTNQHGCGSNSNVNCNLVMQYMCADSADQIRNGRHDERIDDDDAAEIAARNDKIADVNDARNCDDDTNGNCDGRGGNDFLHSQTGDLLDADEVDGSGNVYEYGQHETYEYYQKCKARDRNGGLFTADEPMNNARGATATRQNNNGNAGNNEGWERPEERDYYPYWHPSPWVDIAVLTDNVTQCAYYQAESQNVKAVNECSVPQHNNQIECENNGGQWETVAAKGRNTPDCMLTPFSRDNHLGNSGAMTKDGVKNAFYVWTIPDQAQKFCVFRIRYNISSSDYNGWTTTSDQNDGQSPVTDDPIKLVGDPSQNISVRINVDPNQYGRTFQDRSHVFEIRQRPEEVDGKTIHNVVMRGERGNIVQTYPSTEYDFCPTALDVSKGDYIHFQFAGTDTNQNNQAGNGRDRTDRSNVVQLDHSAGNYPVEYTGDTDADKQFFFSAEEALLMARLGQTNCDENVDPGDDDDVSNCYVLNRATRYFEHLHKIEASNGTYYFASTRNNDFTNRSQKMAINVSPAERISAMVAMLF